MLKMQVTQADQSFVMPPEKTPGGVADHMNSMMTQINTRFDDITKEMSHFSASKQLAQEEAIEAKR